MRTTSMPLALLGFAEGELRAVLSGIGLAGLYTPYSPLIVWWLLVPIPGQPLVF